MEVKMVDFNELNFTNHIGKSVFNPHKKKGDRMVVPPSLGQVAF